MLFVWSSVFRSQRRIIDSCDTLQVMFISEILRPGAVNFFPLNIFLYFWD